MPVGIEQHIGDLLNSDLHPQDFIAISNFFRGTTNFNSLGAEQKRILDSFHMLDSRLSAEMITKQTTLLSMLHRERILSDHQLREVQQIDQSFSVLFRNKKYRNGRFDQNFTKHTNAGYGITVLMRLTSTSAIRTTSLK
jgi:hypothetical protein